MHAACARRPFAIRLRRMSGQQPQNYILHAVGIALVIIVAMVLFLRHSWGG